jgi:AcrR family transcriptional regulator
VSDDEMARSPSSEPRNGSSRYGRYQRAPEARPVDADGELIGAEWATQPDATRNAVISAARALFGGGGYEATALEDVARLAGVTRSALYYHYAGKRAVFEAVYRTVQAELRACALGAYDRAPRSHPRAWRIGAGLQEYLHRTTQPAIQRIVFGDGVAVLGWRRCRAIDQEYSLGALLAGLELAESEGLIEVRAGLERRGYMVSAALREGAYLIGGAADAAAMTAEVSQLIDRVLVGLLSWSPRQPPMSTALASVDIDKAASHVG